MLLKDNRGFVLFLIVLVISLSGSTISYSQKLVFGLKAGATISKSYFSNKSDADEFTNLLKPGFLGAAVVGIPFKKNFSLQVETGFSQRGRKIEFNEGTWLNNASYQFIDGALLLRKSFPIKSSRNLNRSWFISAGPKTSYWLSGNGTITADDQSYDYHVKFEMEPENPVTPDDNTMYLSPANRSLWGLDLGIGIDAPMEALQKFIVELRFTSGQTCYGDKDSAHYPVPGFSDNLLSREKMISLSVLYVLNRETKGGKKGKSTNKDVKKSKPRKNIDSMIH